ncbi:MAG: tetratricopeptide repeat protein [Oleiphilaceae bacterium]
MTARQTIIKSLPGLMLASSLLLSAPLLTSCSSGSESSEALSHLSRAETYSEQGQFRSALLEVKNAIQKDPDNVEHVVRLAELYLQVGGAQEAANLLEPWLQEQPEAVALLLSRAYVEQGKHLSARETLALQTPSSPEAQLEASLIRAEALRKSGEAPEALALYEDLTADNPQNTGAIAGTLKAQINLGQNTKAVNTATDWLEKNEQAPEVLYWKGVAEYRLNHLEQSSATLTDAVGELPTSDMLLPIRRNVLTTLSQVLTEQGKMSEAQIYNRVLAENTNTEARDQAAAAVTALKDGNFEEAKTVLQDTLKLDPGNERIALMLGAVSAGTGELEKGTQLLTENLDPETTPTQFIRAATMAQIDTGEREAALKTLARAIEARPNDSELLAMHGVLALSLSGHEQSGITSLSKAISQAPERTRFRLALAKHYLQDNKPEQALAQLRMAFTANPADWATTSTYLNVLLQKGEKQEAAEIRDSLINGYSNYPRAILLASLTDTKLGNIDKATARLEELVKKEPELQAPKVALASLYAQSEKSEQAVELLINAASVNPDSISPLQQAGRIYMQNHTPAEARAWLVDVGKNHSELERNTAALIALIDISEGNLEQARAVLEQWKDAKSAVVTRVYGRLLLAEAQLAADNKEWAQARTKAAEATALEPDNLSLSLLTVKIAQMEGKIDDAFSALDAVEETHGEVSATMLARAKLLGQQKGPDAAYTYLSEQWQKTNNEQLMPAIIRLAKAQDSGSVDTLTEDWLNQAPQSLAAQLARAEWLMTSNQETAAASHYEKVLAQQPNNVAALNNLAWILRESNSERAIQLAKQANELAPNSAATLDTYGWILHLTGNHAEAETVIEKALTLNPDNEEIESHLESVKKSL